MVSFMVAVAMAPLVLSSAFVPPTGTIRTSCHGPQTFERSSSATGVFSSVPRASARSKVSMAATEQREPISGAEPQGLAASRVQFLGRVSSGMVAAVAAGAAAGEWGLGVAAVSADSTGKYSSKATARKRYLPRIVSLVSAFQLLKKDISNGSATAKAAFFVELLPDSISAMDLYGSSMKRGETPDSKSKALQKLAQDFGSACTSIGKSLGKKGGEADAMKAYDKATTILADYLKGTELEPLGSEVYN